MEGTCLDCPAQPALTCCTDSVRVWSVEGNGGGWETASIRLVSLFGSLTAAALLFNRKLLITHNHKLSINQWRRMVGLQEACERKSVIYGRFWKLEKLMFLGFFLRVVWYFCLVLNKEYYSKSFFWDQFYFFPWGMCTSGSSHKLPMC